MDTEYQNEIENGNFIYLTVDIVSNYVAKNNVSYEDLPKLITLVYDAIKSNSLNETSKPEKEPAVSVKRSVHPDFIVCLEDGKKLTMLKRYLKTNYNMTPEDYRLKWGLPPDYPMVAPNYAEKRSMLAKKSGLGKLTGRKR
ncbi:MAG: MucR family transcriptional regulator [Alphaproteobacteria bacterium]